MEIFNPDIYDAVGFVTEMGLSKNALISCVGMLNRSTGEFVHVPANERSKVFPTRGNVFAFDFLKHHPQWKNECVCLGVKENANLNVVNGEDFVWDWQTDEYIIADKLVSLKAAMGEDGGRNYEILSVNGLIPENEPVYFISGSYIYRADPNGRLLSFWKISSVEDFVIPGPYGNSYLLYDITIPEEGKVDLTSDDQLIGWYKKKVLKKEWNTIYESKDFNSVEDILTAELKSLNIPTNVYTSRLQRILNISSNIALTFDELEDLSTAPWFSDVVLNTYTAFTDLVIEKVKKDKTEELGQIEAENQELIAIARKEAEKIQTSLQQQIEIKQKELDSINERIKKEENEKRAEIERLEAHLSDVKTEVTSAEESLKTIASRKDDIVADFQIIKDVLGTSSNKRQSTSCTHTLIENINYDDERSFPSVGGFRKNLEAYMCRFGAKKVHVDEIVTNLSNYDIVMYPDNESLMATMYATRKCRYCVGYVGVDWKSFSDLWNNGLETIVESAINEPEIIHFLVLRNINMSYLHSYMQPLFDMRANLISYFPGTNIDFPENLKILCTRTDDVVIPMKRTSFHHIGCISNPNDNYSGELTFAEGYLPVSVFNDMPVHDEFLTEESVEPYLDE